MSKQELHLVFGGALADPRENVLSDPNDVDVVGIYPSYEAALDAWRTKSQANVDDVYIRYFVAPVHKLLVPESDA